MGKRIRKGRFFVFWALCFVVLAGLTASVASAAEITINPIKDTTIYQGVDPVTGENFEVNSCGAGIDLFFGVTNDNLLRRALLQFDVAGSLPQNATIRSVTLTVNVNRSGDNVDAPATLLPLSRDWGEGIVDCSGNRGGGVGAPADPGDATWLDAMFQQVLWTNPGGDFGPVSATASIPIRGDGSWTSDAPGNGGMLSDVENWYLGLAQNYGWIIIGDETRASTTRRISSRETGGLVQPRLTIIFDAPGLEECCLPDGGCSLEVDQASCEAKGGIFNPNPDFTETCTLPDPPYSVCPQPTGACCNADESCSDTIERATCEATGGIFQGAVVLTCQAHPLTDKEPFVDALPIPPVLQPVGTRADGVPQYNVTATAENQVLHRDLPATGVWTYNGAYPSFTIEARVGQPIEVTYVNNLPTARGQRGSHLLEVDECPHGPNYYGDSARMVTHLHGAHIQARFDGQPEYTILPGETDVYEYPNNQLPATLWYHDHALGITRLNVYGGMAGFYLLRDDVEDALGLPSGEFEIETVIQDREFNPDGSLFYPPTLQDAFFGDKILVNGKVWPFLNVSQGKYRFRLLNGSQARSYSLRLENLANPAQVIPFTLIGTDLGLISAPITLNTISTMTSAERFDVIIDFAGFPAGTEIVLRNDDPTTPLLPNVMKFIVQNQPGFTGPIPTTLRTVTPIPESEASITRSFRLEQVPDPCAGNEWLVRTLDGPGGNPTGEDHWDDIVKGVQLGTTEIWAFENPSNLMHPMHVHLVAFQVLDRTPLGGGQALPLDPWEDTTWKDTVKVPPGTVVRVIARYEDYLGKFPFHCHILDHEDHEMMRQFQVTNDPANCNANLICEPGEDCFSCPTDCAEVSGALCGNGLCEAGDGENCLTCPSDCAGNQKGNASNQFCCGDTLAGNPTNPILCGGGPNSGDLRCIDASANLFCRVAPRVLACCGDALCEGAETASTCANDCAPAVDCSIYTTSSDCKGDPNCTWSGKDKICTNL